MFKIFKILQDFKNVQNDRTDCGKMSSSMLDLHVIIDTIWFILNTKKDR